eukprot:TRINITY_DN287_c4_g1_i2.p1 TRINITY_DN287_c4_g1~~TRINITY_DN287_c4_g1_i2.p1  ORF type:complete len:1267 (+),score=324.43 TRINITY_DN287_c4_g1_i2:27-3803(+)
MNTFETFSGKNVLLTGGCGFLGKLLVEKLLRVLNVGTIFLVIREKNKPPHQRLYEILDSPVFSLLRQGITNFKDWALKKICVISGDLRQTSLGIAEADKKKLENVHYVIHCAAHSDFNAPFDQAVQTNIIGSEELLRVAKESMPLLQSFVFVSSAYVNSNQKGKNIHCEEKLYPLKLDMYKSLKKMQVKGALETEELTKTILAQYPNSHSYTKSVAEHSLVANLEGLNAPLVIIRPSMIGCTLAQPFPGWCETLSVCGSLFMYCGLGLMSFVPGDPNFIADLIPADYVVDHVLFAITHTVNQQLKAGPSPPEGNSKIFKNNIGSYSIYHVSSSNTNPLRWGYANQTAVSYWRRNPLQKMLSPSTSSPTLSTKSKSSASATNPIRTSSTASGGVQSFPPPSMTMFPTYFGYRSQYMLKYEVPSNLYSFVSHLVNSPFHKQQATKVKNVVKKSHNFIAKGLYEYLNNDWIFVNNNSQPILTLLTKQKQLELARFGPESPTDGVYSYDFEFDVSKIDWHRYLNFYCYGIQRYIFKENISPPKEREIEFDRLRGHDLLEQSNDQSFFPDLRFALFTSLNVDTPNATKQSQQRIKELVLTSDVVRNAMSETLKSNNSNQQQQLTRAALEAEVQKTYEVLEARMDIPKVMRPLGYFFRKIWKKLYSGINVNNSGLEKIKALSKEGGSPIIYLPSHRSYIDFLILSYVLFESHLPLPHIAAGEDFLGIKFVCSLLRAGGAFFLRRSFTGDKLYTAIFSEYVKQLARESVPIEFFIEGTRSRSGKSLPPKFGLLGMLLDSYFSGEVGDIHFVPIHINYEKVVEGQVYPNELLGKPKRRESLQGLIDARYILKQDFGRIAVKIGDPLSLKSYIQSLSSKFNHHDVTTQPPPKNQQQQQQQLYGLSRNFICEKLGYKMVYEINEKSVWSAISIVASILLTYRYGITREELIFHTNWIQNDILQRQRGYFDWLLEQNPTALVAKGLQQLDESEALFFSRSSQGETIKADSDPESIILLGFYRNRIIHLFTKEAALLCSYHALAANALSSSPSSSSSSPAGVPFSRIIQEADFIHHLMHLEVIYKEDPSEPEDHISTLNTLITQGVLVTDQVSTPVGTEIIVKFNTLNNNAVTSPQARQISDFYCHMLWPFVESYFITSLLLLQLKPDGIPSNSLVGRCQWLANNLINQGKCFSSESASKETLSNSINFFLKHGVVVKKNGKIYLSPEYSNNNSQLLTDLVLRINRLRKRTTTFENITDLISKVPILSKL